jgi:hypothetical protein
MPEAPYRSPVERALLKWLGPRPAVVGGRLPVAVPPPSPELPDDESPSS